ncbi:MAG: ParB/RepB/Spo0J family partition protein [Planctomycetota bacterium]
MLRAKEFTIELEKIDAGENPLRLEGENKGIAELSESIKRIGLINPLVVAPDPNGDHYRLIAGHRRFAACRRAGLKEVAVRITQTDQREICEVALAENLGRGYDHRAGRDRLQSSYWLGKRARGNSKLATGCAGSCS